MITAESLPFTTSDVGIKKGYEFNGAVYFIRLRRNDQNNFFTLEIFDEDDNFIYASKLNYRYPICDEVVADLPFVVIPLDLAEFSNSLFATKEITDETLGDPVKLYTSIQIT